MSRASPADTDGRRDGPIGLPKESAVLPIVVLVMVLMIGFMIMLLIGVLLAFFVGSATSDIRSLPWRRSRTDASRQLHGREGRSMDEGSFPRGIPADEARRRLINRILVVVLAGVIAVDLWIAYLNWGPIILLP